MHVCVVCAICAATTRILANCDSLSCPIADYLCALSNRDRCVWVVVVAGTLLVECPIHMCFNVQVNRDATSYQLVENRWVVGR